MFSLILFLCKYENALILYEKHGPYNYNAREIYQWKQHCEKRLLLNTGIGASSS